MKRFMKAFAVVASGFAAHAASAAHLSETVLKSAEGVVTPKATPSTEKLAVRTAEGDAFNFVLKRASEDGKLMAWHESHASHASHASHRSHYSGY